MSTSTPKKIIVIAHEAWSDHAGAQLILHDFMMMKQRLNNTAGLEDVGLVVGGAC